jgi:vacuolar-type H+-ATPase subunit E/Vma4
LLNAIPKVVEKIADMVMEKVADVATNNEFLSSFNSR